MSDEFIVLDHTHQQYTGGRAFEGDHRLIKILKTV